MELDWAKPLMLRDGRFCRLGGDGHGGDKWVEFWGPDWNGDECWLKEVVTRHGVHVCNIGQAKLPDVINQPSVDMDQPLYWLDNNERAFIRQTNVSVDAVTSYAVDDPTGRLWTVLPDGQVQGLPPRVLGNMTLAQQQAEARASIKRAQEKRAAQRERDALDQLEQMNPHLFGAF